MVGMPLGGNATFYAGSIYPGAPSGQTQVNTRVNTDAPPSHAAGGRGNWNAPVLSGVAAGAGVSVPMLIALGVLAWVLFRVN